MRILITGSSGLIGKILFKSLINHELSGLDKFEFDNNKSFHGDITDIDSILPFFENTDVVIHLAANPNSNADWKSVSDTNLLGTYNVFEASRLSKCKRVIFASSNHVVGMYELVKPYSSIVAGNYNNLSPGSYSLVDHKVSIRPDGHYGISKQYGESLGRFYFDKFGIEFACIRIGSVNTSNSPLVGVRQFATWCSYRDISQLVQKCIDIEKLGFQIFYGVSNNSWRFWDINHARSTVGYDPQDNAEIYRTQFEKLKSPS